MYAARPVAFLFVRGEVKLGTPSLKIVMDLYGCMLAPSGGGVDACLPQDETDATCLHTSDRVNCHIAAC